jgi:hypothetical protein
VRLPAAMLVKKLNFAPNVYVLMHMTKRMFWATHHQAWAIQIDGTIDRTVILLPPKIPWKCTITIYRPYLIGSKQGVNGSDGK